MKDTRHVYGFGPALETRQSQRNNNVTIHATTLEQIEERETINGIEFLKPPPASGDGADAPPVVDFMPVYGQSLALGASTERPDREIKHQYRFGPESDALRVAGLHRGDWRQCSVKQLKLRGDVDFSGPSYHGYDETIPAKGLDRIGFTPFLRGFGVPLVVNLNRLRRITGAPRRTVLGGTNAVGGIELTSLRTKYKGNLAFLAAEAAPLAEAYGVTLCCHWLPIIQGEANRSSEADEWLQGFRGFVAFTRALYEELGIEGKFKPIIMQTGGATKTAEGTYRWAKLEQLHVARCGEAVLAGPLYPYGLADAIHPTGYETFRFGELMAWAIAEEEQHAGAWRSLAPVSAKLCGKVVEIQLDARNDEALIASDPAKYEGKGVDNLGLEADGATIENVELQGNRIVVMCTDVPTETRYALQDQDCRGSNYAAHRGLIRTTLTRAARWGGMLERWVPSFKITIDKTMNRPELA